ncbi:MAG: hypothetical protein H6734_06675 [Alphaproteobacteria bacterium]|nr:hypothetical protein [Alphaproteobacteria bacterium]
MTTIERSWTHGQRALEVRRGDAGYTLAIDGQGVLTDDREGFELLARHVAAAVTSRPFNAGRPWRPDDDAVLAARFGAGDDDVTLAASLDRTKNAIRARLVKLGLTEDTGGWRRYA